MNAPDVGVREDLYVAGRRDDGTDFIGCVYYVVAENEDGSRQAHDARFAGVRVEADEDGVNHFIDTREEAQARADHLAARVVAALAAGGILHWSHWSDIDPAYGSDAWQEMDAGGFFYARERAEEMGVA